AADGGHRAGDHARRRDRPLKRALIALACAVSTPAAAQRRVEAAAFVAAVELRVDPGSGLERFSGPMIGAEALMNVGTRWVFAVRVGDGSLTAGTPGGLNRDVGGLSRAGRVHAGTGLSFSAGVCRDRKRVG